MVPVINSNKLRSSASLTSSGENCMLFSQMLATQIAGKRNGNFLRKNSEICCPAPYHPGEGPSQQNIQGGQGRIWTMWTLVLFALNDLRSLKKVFIRQNFGGTVSRSLPGYVSPTCMLPVETFGLIMTFHPRLFQNNVSIVHVIVNHSYHYCN